MKFIIYSIGKVLLLMVFCVSTSQAIALYSTLTETLYMDCVQHSSGTGPAYRVDLELTTLTDRSKQPRMIRQVLIPTQIVKMSDTQLCQLGVDPYFDNDGANIIMDIPQLDVVDNNGDGLGVMNAQIMAGMDLQFDILKLGNLNLTQVMTENRPLINVTSLEPEVAHSLNSSEVGVCLKLTPTITADDKIELHVHVAVSIGKSEPNNIISIPRVLVTDSITKTSSEATTIFNFGDYVAVPVLSDIPALGYLFKHKQNTSSKKNLLIIVTPETLNCREQES